LRKEQWSSGLNSRSWCA